MNTDQHWPISAIKPRVRVITDNDYSGDPDGLIQLAHHLLSKSCDIRAIIGSHLGSYDDAWMPAEPSAAAAVKKAEEVLALCNMTGQVPVLKGSEVAMEAADKPVDNEAVDFIIAEAMREDSDLPLFVVCGGSLTQIASAWLKEPRIADRLTVVWIGGGEYPGVHVPEGAPVREYNLHEDPHAGMVVFNQSNLKLWQVPRDVYRQTIYSRHELALRMAPHGPLGDYLFAELGRVVRMVEDFGFNAGESYVLGDSPLVLLTALQTTFEPDTASSFHRTLECPTLNWDGTYTMNPNGRPIRVYHQIDNRLMFEDFYAKLELFAAGRL